MIKGADYLTFNGYPTGYDYGAYAFYINYILVMDLKYCDILYYADAIILCKVDTWNDMLNTL